MDDIRDIKQIVDKIVKEGDINPAEYTVEDRIADVNEHYLYYIEKATQIGSSEPISVGEAISEQFNVVAGSNSFTKLNPDIPMLRVDFQFDGSSSWETVTQDTSRFIGGFDYCGMRFFADEKRVFIENGQVGKLRVTYARGGIILFKTSDYSLSTPPEPEWLPREFRKLLWLAPATIQAEYYKKDRAVSLRNQLTRVEEQFFNHYSRKSATTGRIITESNNCGGNNYR